MGGRRPERTTEISQGLSGDDIRRDTPGSGFPMGAHPERVQDASGTPGCPLIEMHNPGEARPGAGDRCPCPWLISVMPSGHGVTNAHTCPSLFIAPLRGDEIESDRVICYRFEVKIATMSDGS